MANAASLGVTAASSVTSRFSAATNPVFATLGGAQYVGSLSQDTSSIQVMSQLSYQAPHNYYKFYFTSGENMKLALSANSGDTSGMRVRLYDAVGTLVADSEGTAAQQAAYTSLTSADGLAAANGQYTVRVGYANDKAGAAEGYNLQLFSGTTYTSQATTSAITQAYDPNLFVSASSTVNAADNYSIYSRAATLNGTDVTLGTLVYNQTELYNKGTLTNTSSSQTYSFDNTSRNPVKFILSNTTNDQTLRVQLYDKTGKTLIADNEGTDAQKEAYQRMMSGAGLKLDQATYKVKISYASGDLMPETSYALHINSGTTYSKQYKTTTTAGTSTTASSSSKLWSQGANLNIFSDYDAQIYKRNEFNQINAKPADAINIGWLRKDASALEVLSRLTKDNHTNFFRFTVQQSDNIKATVKNLSDSRTVRVQVLDSSGYRVIADNQGTEKQKAAFASFASDTGLSLKKGDYVLKTSYAKSESEKDNLNYSVNLYSGTTYTSRYRVIASAQTYQNFIARGGTIGYSAAGTYANQLQSLSQGGELDILSGLSTSV